MLGAHAHAGPVVQQAAGLREADQGGGRAAHARHARGQVGARHAQRPVAQEEAVAAAGAVVVGALQGQPAQDRLDGLGAAPGVACRLPAGARQGGAGVIAAVGVEALFHGPRRQFQRELAEAGLQRLEVDGVRRAGSYEAGELGFDGGGELLRADFFFASARMLVPVWRKRAGLGRWRRRRSAGSGKCACPRGCGRAGSRGRGRDLLPGGNGRWRCCTSCSGGRGSRGAGHNCWRSDYSGRIPRFFLELR